MTTCNHTVMSYILHFVKYLPQCLVKTNKNMLQNRPPSRLSSPENCGLFLIKKQSHFITTLKKKITYQNFNSDDKLLIPKQKKRKSYGEVLTSQTCQTRGTIWVNSNKQRSVCSFLEKSRFSIESSRMIEGVLKPTVESLSSHT